MNMSEDLSSSKRSGEIREIKKGSFLIMDNEPCKVVDVQTSAPGKHGHAKARIEGFGIFDGSRHTIVMPTHSKCDIPIVDKKQAQVLAVQEGKVQLMDLTTYENFWLDLPEEMKPKTTPSATVEYWEVMGKRILKAL